VTPTLLPQMVLDINTNTQSTNPSQMAAVGSITYFAADDGVHGIELWRSDGTAAGTTIVKDIYPGGFTGNYGGYYHASSYPSNLTNLDGTLFFTAADSAGGRHLWKSDGTETGTVLVSSSFGYLYDLTEVNDTLFFAADGGGGTELWRSDGTTAGTTLVKDIYPGQSLQYFGYYLGWQYVQNSSSPGELTVVSGTLYFTAGDGANGRELWTSDGTEAGTVPVKDIRPGSTGSYPSSLTVMNGTLFFSANDGTTGWELWRSDGTAAGTALFKDINPGGGSSSSSNLTNVNGTLFFSTNDGSTGWELWRSDGTAAGTVLVKDINPDSTSSNPNHLTNADGTLFFVAWDGEHGYELWKSDGTSAGTTLVKDVYPGDNSTYPRYLTAVNGTLFFSAYEYSGVTRLWRSDGTEAGTVPVANLAAYSLANVNGTLFFAADDGIHGEELWKLVDYPTQGSSLAVSGLPVTITAGGNGSFTVTAKNADGTTNTGYLGRIHFTSSDPQAALPDDYTFTAADGGVHTFSVTLKTAGSQTITVSDTVIAGGTGTQAGVTVSPAAASRLTVAGFASPVSAGEAGTFTVTARDPFGNVAVGYLGAVHFASIDGQATLPADYTFTAVDAGSKAFTAAFKTAGTRSITASEAGGGLIGLQTGIYVTPASAASFQLAGLPTTLTAGVVSQFTLTVRDAFGNTATGYAGTVHFASTDWQAVLPADYTFTAADAGARAFAVTLETNGPRSVTTRDAVNGLLQSVATTVTPAAASFFTISGLSSPVTAGQAVAFTVTAGDPFGNVAAGYTGTVRFTCSDAQATLPADYTFIAADGGRKAFTATLRTAGVWSLTAADTATASFTGGQTGVVVAPAAAASFALTGLPAGVTAGAAAAIAVTAKDAFGNVAAGYAGTVHFASTDPQATLPADYTFTTAGGGSKAFAATFRTAGGQGLTASAVGAGPTPATASTAVAAADPARLTVRGVPPATTAGAQSLLLVTVEDPFGNRADYSGPVSVAVADPLGTAAGGTTADGQLVSTITYRTAGTWVLTVSAPGLPDATATTAVAAGSVNRIVVSGIPSPAFAGTPAAVTISTFDPFGNPTRAVVRFASTDPQAALPAVSAVDGAGTFAVTLRTSGAQAVTATDLWAAVSGSQAGIDVVPAPPPPRLPVPALAGGQADGTAIAYTPSGGRYGRGCTLTFFPGLGVDVRTATADVNGDGVPDFVGGTGPGTPTQVVVLDGKTEVALATLSPFEVGFTGGVYVAAADLDGDGKAEVVVSPDRGGGPVVAVYGDAKLTAGRTGDAAQVVRFFGIDDLAFRGGARAALGDINGDGVPGLVVSAGFGGGPRVAIFDGESVAAGSPTPVKLVADFFAFEPSLRNGAFVAAGDVDGDGRADLAFGGGAGGAPRVRVFDGAKLLATAPFPNLDAVPAAQAANFFAGDPSLRGGVRLALRDAGGGGKADLVTGSGEGEPSRVRVFNAANLLAGGTTPDQEIDPFGATLAGGVFVG
jgi:ELWxxDGT repeat protein